MHHNKSPAYTRWHDEVPELGDALETIRKMEAPYQEIFSRMIYSMSEIILSNRRTDQAVTELGIKRIGGLFKAQCRKRWYDKDPAMYQAMRKLHQLDENAWKLIGNKLNLAIEAVAEYTRLCQRRQKKVVPKHMMMIADLAIANGEKQLILKLKEWGLWDKTTEELSEQNLLFRSSEERPNPMLKSEGRNTSSAPDSPAQQLMLSEELAIPSQESLETEWELEAKSLLLKHIEKQY